MSAPPLALLGGSFDPVHCGHLRMALEVVQALDADVRLVPAAAPPHRGAPRVEAAHRVAMLRVAIEGSTRIGIDTREMDAASSPYTVDTLRAVRREIGLERALLLVIGSDQCAALDTWREWRAIFDLSHVLVLNRRLPARANATNAADGSGMAVESELADFVEARSTSDPGLLRHSPFGSLLRLDNPLLDISSTRVRTDLAAGRSPRWLLPDPVLAYIHEHALYARAA